VSDGIEKDGDCILFFQLYFHGSHFAVRMENDRVDAYGSCGTQSGPSAANADVSGAKTTPTLKDSSVHERLITISKQLDSETETRNSTS
jgi:hypothetical protein